MNKLDRWLTAYADAVVREVARSGYSGINVVEKILKDPGISTEGSGHRVLWWPRSRRVSSVSKVMHHLSGMERFCIIVRYARPVDEETGRVYRPRDLERLGLVRADDYKAHVSNGRKKIQKGLSQLLENKAKTHFF